MITHNNINNYLLLEASKINNKALLNESVKNKGDINYMDQYNRNALHYAVIYNSNDIIKHLDDLKNSALQNKNIFSSLMEVTKYCSLGQITDSLFSVGGQYRRNM